MGLNVILVKFVWQHNEIQHFNGKVQNLAKFGRQSVIYHILHRHGISQLGKGNRKLNEPMKNIPFPWYTNKLAQMPCFSFLATALRH